MRRRTSFRKRRQLWLPTYGTGGTTIEGVTSGAAVGGDLDLFNDGSEAGAIDWLTTPLTFDTQIDPENAQQDTALGAFAPRLRELTAGSEWNLRRVVGKIFCGVSATFGTRAISPPAIEVGAGLIVVNCDEDGIPTTDFDQVNPLAQQSVEDPWIWERHWMLGTYAPSAYSASNLTPIDLGSQLPMSNVGKPAFEGPHVDQKTARHIKRDQRLFLVVATRPSTLVAGDTFEANGTGITVYFRYMFRLLGNIRGTSGNRGNAAR